MILSLGTVGLPSLSFLLTQLAETDFGETFRLQSPPCPKWDQMNEVLLFFLWFTKWRYFTTHFWNISITYFSFTFHRTGLLDASLKPYYPLCNKQHVLVYPPPPTPYPVNNKRSIKVYSQLHTAWILGLLPQEWNC